MLDFDKCRTKEDDRINIPDEIENMSKEEIEKLLEEKYSNK